MKEALIIFLVGLILGTSYVHSAPLDIRPPAQIQGENQYRVKNSVVVKRTPTPAQTQQKEIKYLIDQSEELVEDATQSTPSGWPGMNLAAEIEDLQDQINAVLPSATKAEQNQLQVELQRLQGALNLLNGQT